MNPAVSPVDVEAAKAFAEAREPAHATAAVIRFHRRVDEVLAVSIAAHGVVLACAPGCATCCSLRVEVLPVEAFRLATWLRTRLTAARLDEVLGRLRHNVAVTAALGGTEARKRTNLPCALLDGAGSCSAYEARPAQCRRYHSARLATCESIYSNPTDDALEGPMDPVVAHNAAVVVAQNRNALREAGLDAEPVDLNHALLAALANPKAWRRWRDGKKAFPGMQA